MSLPPLPSSAVFPAEHVLSYYDIRRALGASLLLTMVAAPLLGTVLALVPFALWLLLMLVCHGLLLYGSGLMPRSTAAARLSFMVIPPALGLLWGSLTLAIPTSQGATALGLVGIVLMAVASGALACWLSGGYRGFLVALLGPLLLSLGLSDVASRGLLLLVVAGVGIVLWCVHGYLQWYWQQLRLTCNEVEERCQYWQQRFQQLDSEHRQEQDRFKALQEQEIKYRTLIESLGCGLYLLDGDRCRYANPAFALMSGYSQEALLASPIAQWIHPDDRDRVLSPGNRLLGRPETDALEFRLLRQDGESVPVLVLARTLVFENQLIGLGIVIDITDRHCREQQWCQRGEYLQAVLNAIPEAVVATDAAGTITYLNPVAAALSGWSIASAAGMTATQVLTLREPDSQRRLADPWYSCQETGQHNRFYERLLLQPHGRTGQREVSLHVAALGRDNALQGAVALLRPQDGWYGLAPLQEHQLQDPLTGLANRPALLRRLHGLLQQEGRSESSHGLWCLELDDYTPIHAEHGKAAADTLLRDTALFLSEQLEIPHLLARLDEHQLGVLLPHCEAAISWQWAESICQAALAHTVSWQDQRLSASMSVGVAVVASSDRWDQCVGRASLACGIAREQGGGCCHHHSAADAGRLRYQDDLLWVERLRTALEQNRLCLHCQVSHALRPGAPSYGELLVRFLDDNDSPIVPGEFLSVAERFHLLPQLDRWVIRHTLKALAANHTPLDELAICSINLSGQSLDEPGVGDFIIDELQRHGINGGRLCFEISESTLIGHRYQAQALMRQLQPRGCHFALDDFGSGFQSLAWLGGLPVNYLKIDVSFIEGLLSSDSAARTIVEAIVQLGHELGLSICAEAVSDHETSELLQRLHVDYLQGYAIAYPIPVTPPSAVGF